ncbi:hypothetical protein [Streptomyces cyaneofuscatus]|uniref:hypothetical protein n=1 Tax=Streptomyces cyaneofuscatus TaxID=66883 RepID=UPI00365FCDDC
MSRSPGSTPPLGSSHSPPEEVVGPPPEQEHPAALVGDERADDVPADAIPPGVGEKGLGQGIGEEGGHVGSSF